MNQYFPSSYPKGRQCDRDYMFNIANTLHQGIVQELIDHAVKQRHDPKMGDNKSESILISDRWREELSSLPLTNRVRYTFILYHVDIGSQSRLRQCFITLTIYRNHLEKREDDRSAEAEEQSDDGIEVEKAIRRSRCLEAEKDRGGQHGKHHAKDQPDIEQPS